MRILLTGITGFIGQWLLPELSAKDDLYAVCLSSTERLPSHVHRLEADLGQPAELFGELKTIRPDVCVHLAWEGIPDYGFETSRRNLEQGAGLFHHLVQECGCRKIVAAGSCWEYGKNFGVCREDDPRVPTSYFVWAKHSLSDLGLTLAASQGISFVWMRLFYVYGPGQRGAALIPTLAQSLRKGQRPIIKTPHNANDFVFVADVAKALSQVTSRDIPSGVYNLGSGQSVPVWKVCETLERAMGVDPSYSMELKNTKTPAAADFWADASKADRILGWRATTSLDEGIRQYILTSGG